MGIPDPADIPYLCTTKTPADMAYNESDARLLTPSMKLADLLDLNCNLIGVLSRTGIPFGFGDETVEEACRKHGVNVQTFLLICQVYTFDGYMPSSEVLRSADLRDIVGYLRRSHAYYMDIAMKDLAESVERAIAPCDERRKHVIRQFFTAYKEELSEHFRYEEETVFPYVESVLSHAAGEDFTIIQYEENHTNVEEKLGDLKNIIMKYLPAECDNRHIADVLFRLYLLETDLEKHTSIEDDILVPVVNRLEIHER